MRRILTAMLCLGLLADSASAHFIWVTIETADGQSAVQTFFAEEPAAGEAHLIDKIDHSQIAICDADGKRTPLAVSKQVRDELGWLEAELAQPAAAVELQCEYGVYHGMLLQYYAKHLRLDNAGQRASLARAKQWPLDIAPTLSGDTLQLRLLWQGKPVADAKLTVTSPAHDAEELTTNQQGIVHIASPATGSYAILASYVEEDKGGEHDGEAYTETGHYATLTLTLPSTQAAPRAATDDEPTATELLAQTRANRAVWDDFPGFTADLLVTIDAQQLAGKLQVSPSGRLQIELQGDDTRDAEQWIKRNLGSLVMHRMPDGSLGSEAEYADADRVHPLGRKLELKGDGMGSIYRISDDRVVRQVNRRGGGSHFTISVQEVVWNAEGKYLPRLFTVSSWNDKTEALQSTSQSIHEYQRVGAFDLPSKLLEIQAGADAYSARKLELSNLELTAPLVGEASGAGLGR